jgi:hypothetical protein
LSAVRMQLCHAGNVLATQMLSTSGLGTGGGLGFALDLTPCRWVFRYTRNEWAVSMRYSDDLILISSICPTCGHVALKMLLVWGKSPSYYRRV